MTISGSHLLQRLFLGAAGVALVGAAITPAVGGGRRQRSDLSGRHGMVLLQGGEFLMGTGSADNNARHGHGPSGNRKPNLAEASGSSRETGADDERPAHRVILSPFYIDRTEVTNEDFSRFVAATGYVTDAEKKGFSWVFRKGLTDFEAIRGADWRHPTGPDSDIDATTSHPVVNVSWNDAAAYAKWSKKRLPTEAEWEYAARGGRVGEIYPWGNDLMPGGRTRANFWQGNWPDDNKLEDGYYYTSPVARFEPNGFGLHDMIGNVWEWTADWYQEDYYGRSRRKNPKGSPSGDARVARGGSWFCSENYCGAYRVAFRGKSPPGSSFNNVGFRCARSAK